MAIPTYQQIYRDMLQITSDGNDYSIAQLRQALATRLHLTQEDLELVLPSGTMRLWDSRVGWCKTYLVKAGLLMQPKRGVVRLTERGRDVLKENPEVLDDKYLLRFPEFREFALPSIKVQTGQQQPEPESVGNGNPREQLERGYERLRRQTELDMLERIKAAPPEFFERLVVDLLVKMGYGGSWHEVNSSLVPGKVVGKSGDAGIDGVIKEDRLGLDTVYIQAKRWSGTAVGRPEVQQFAGALHGKRSRKGVMLTTSRFTPDAKEFVESIETKIVLVDGQQLVELMFDHNLGCSRQNLFEVKTVDEDYFENESE